MMTGGYRKLQLFWAFPFTVAGKDRRLSYNHVVGLLGAVTPTCHPADDEVLSIDIPQCSCNK
jgi:hypothetical protein